MAQHHWLAIAGTGAGKSTLIHEMASALAWQMYGDTQLVSDTERPLVVILDPQSGELFDVLSHMPGEVAEHVHCLALDWEDDRYRRLGIESGAERRFTWNPLQPLPREAGMSDDAFEALLAAQVDAIVQLIKFYWVSGRDSASWGDRMEAVLRICLRTLIKANVGLRLKAGEGVNDEELEYFTLLDIKPMLEDTGYGNGIVDAWADTQTTLDWRDWFLRWDQEEHQAVSSPIRQKIMEITANPLLKQVFGGGRPNSIDLRRTLDEGGFLLINLPVGHAGISAVGLLSGFLLDGLRLELERRLSTPRAKRRPVFVIVDEPQYVPANYGAWYRTIAKFGGRIGLAAQGASNLETPAMPDLLRHINDNVTLYFVGRVSAMPEPLYDSHFGDIVPRQMRLNVPVGHFYVKIAGYPLFSMSCSTPRTSDTASPPPARADEEGSLGELRSERPTTCIPAFAMKASLERDYVDAAPLRERAARDEANALARSHAAEQRSKARGPRGRNKPTGAVAPPAPDGGPPEDLGGVAVPFEVGVVASET